MNWIELINKEIKLENVGHPHCKEERAHLFHTFDFSSTEIEYLNLLHSLILVLKPITVLETGTFYGSGSIAIGAALKENGVGKLITLENNKDFVIISKNNIKACHLEDYIDIITIDSLNFIENNTIKFDFVFFDSETKSRAVEFKALYKKNCLTNIVSFHDTSRLRMKTYPDQKGINDKYLKDLDYISKNYCNSSIEFKLSRGFRLMQLKKEKE